MFNAILPAIYRRLRIRTGMTQEEFGVALGVTRVTVSRFESGRAHPTPEQEAKMMELAKCSKDEAADLLCRRVSEVIERPVVIDNAGAGYEPTTAVARTGEFLREHAGEIPPPWARVLRGKLDTTRMMGLAFERNNEDLMELTRVCRQEMIDRRERDGLRN